MIINVTEEQKKSDRIARLHGRGVQIVVSKIWRNFY